MKVLNAVLILLILWLAIIITEPHFRLPYDYFIAKLDGYKIEKTTDEAPWGNEKVNYIFIFSKKNEPLAVIIRSLKNTTILIVIKRSQNGYYIWEKEKRNVRIKKGRNAKTKEVQNERRRTLPDLYSLPWQNEILFYCRCLYSRPLSILLRLLLSEA